MDKGKVLFSTIVGACGLYYIYSRTKRKRTEQMIGSRRKLFLVGVGNVGYGILEAFHEARWGVIAVDPNPLMELDSPNVTFIREKIEDISDSQLHILLNDCGVIVYAADCGNRDLYAIEEFDNTSRFDSFVKRVKGRRIEYVGGSWTRRIAIDGSVCDESPTKQDGGSNPYERAKSSACENSKRLSEYSPITFYDWISVVPNFAPNFSICKMTESARESEIISYTPGDFGRPLLHRKDAGRALLSYIQNRCHLNSFEIVIIPGAFIPFQKWAESIQNNIPIEADLQHRLDQPPDFLSWKCVGSKCMQELPWKPNERMAIHGLGVTAQVAWYPKRMASLTNG